MNEQVLELQIKDRRKTLKVQQEDLAEISGVALRNVVAIEQDEGNPSLETLFKLLEVLGMKIYRFCI